MKAAGIIGTMYGALVVAGGVIGYLTAGSLPSVLAGGGCGVAMFLSAWAMLRGKRVGWYAALILTAALAVFFGARFWQGGAFLPTGLMAGLSALTAALLLLTSAVGKRKAVPRDQ